MQVNELYQLLCGTGLNVSYFHVGKGEALPYVVYYSSGGNVYGSDDKNSIEKNDYVIELYSDKKSLKDENKIKTVLNNAGINYTINESYIDTESMYLVAFYIDTIRKVR